ncbi:MAG: PAS domain S-box protein [Clostridiaceae bacterium]|nr:PAS domain S-box protein [Clostridiaceae bacterium]
MINEKEAAFKIRSKYYRMVGTLIGILILLIIVAGVYITAVQSELSKEREKITQKFIAVESLEETLMQVLFRARGYYAFQDQWELEQLNKSLEQFKTEIEAFKTLDLTEEEMELRKDLESFYFNYSNNLLPLAISYVERDDYEALRTLSSGGVNTEINNFLDYTKRFKIESEAQREAIYEEIIKVSNQFKIITTAIGALGLFMMIFMVGRLLKEIVFPIEALSNATKLISKGERTYLTETYPPNEIGLLALSFQEMLEKIHEKEEELTAQNEELISQQDELQNQQEKLRNYLIEVENIKKALDQSATVCITDKKGVILSVNEMFCKTTQFEKEALIGNTTRVLKSGFHQEAFYKDMWETIESGRMWNGEMKNRKKDGTYFWMNATIVPYINTEGRPYQYILIGIDITETKKIQEKLKELLEETKFTKEKIERYSDLNQYLTMTLEKEKFLEVVFNYFKEVYTFDKGILVHTRDMKYRAKGLTKEKLEKFLKDENMQEITLRLKGEKYFVVKREAKPNEGGIAEEIFYCYDLYSSILSTDGTVEGFFALTRIGIPFQKEEVEEINGLMKQLSVALSRINMYEEVENTKNLNENIIENVNEGLQLVSLEGEMLQYNQILISLLELEGYRDKHTEDKEIWIENFTRNCKEKDTLKAFFEEAIDPFTSESKEIRYTIRGGREGFIQVYASPVFMHKQKIGTIFVYRDITKEYEIDKMKSELVSTVSHELRTPLSSVLGFTEMLLMKELKPERQKKYLETIHKEAKRLTNLINDFLDLQRMESGKQEYTMTVNPVNEIAMEIIEKFKHEKRHNIYVVDEAAFVRAKIDKDRMMQVFSNLISNAIKFSPEGGDIAITFKNHENTLIVSIKDEGIGIPAEALPNIFDKFKRIDNSETRKIGGTGLGLAICKEIIEAHGGRIWTESQEGKGTTVFFSLSFYQEEGNEYIVTEEEEKKYDEDKQHANVMLVEDDISLALLLSEALKSRGFTVFHYTNPKNALEGATEIPLVGIVIDLMLGDEMSGWDLIQQLKEVEKTKNIPIIISSAIERSEENIKKYEVYDYLVKPYPPNQLAKRLLELLKSQEVFREERRGEGNE